MHKAKTVEELQEAVEILEWVDSRKLPSGVLAEQVNPYTNAPMSVSPLTWSHATVVDVVQSYLEKREAVERCPTCGGPKRRKIEGYERSEPDRCAHARPLRADMDETGESVARRAAGRAHSRADARW